MNITKDLDLVMNTTLARHSGVSRQLVHRLVQSGEISPAGKVEDDAGKVFSIFHRTQIDDLKRQHRLMRQSNKPL
jgi:hypothetical protein